MTWDAAQADRRSQEAVVGSRCTARRHALPCLGLWSKMLGVARAKMGGMLPIGMIEAQANGARLEELGGVPWWAQRVGSDS